MPDSNIPNPHTETAEWVKFKRRKIGGHAAVTLSGASYSSDGQKSYQTQQELFDLIVHGIVDPITAEKERFFAWRLAQEPLIADRYVEETGRMVRRCGSVLHPENEQIICSPDREILKDSRGMGLLEIKSRDPMVWRTIKLKGFPGADWVQTQLYLMVRGLSWGAICECNISTGQILKHDIEADPEFHRAIYDRITRFLVSCELKKRPPEETKDPMKIPEVGGELVTTEQMNSLIAGEFMGVAAMAVEARNLRDRAKLYYEEVKTESQKWMIANRFDVVEGFGARIYNKEVKGKTKFDKKALKSDHPEIDLTKYESRGKPSRRFQVYDRPVAIDSKGPLSAAMHGLTPKNGE